MLTLIIGVAHLAVKLGFLDLIITLQTQLLIACIGAVRYNPICCFYDIPG